MITALELIPYYFAPLTPTISSAFKTALALRTADTSTSPPTKAGNPSTTSQTEEPLTLLGSNRPDFITLQLQDPTLKLIHKYLSAGSKKSAIYRYILTAVCPFSHFLVAIPTADRSATTTARAMFDNVLLKLDFPSTLFSDRGGEFLNAAPREVSRLLSIKQVFTFSYRPRANRTTESVHRFMNSALAISRPIKLQKQWEDYLQPAVSSHNTSAIDGTDCITPFFLMFGRNATSPETVALQLPSEPISKNEYAKHLVQRISEAHNYSPASKRT